MMRTKYIRNFAIVAHIDHGKSTLADRLLELTHTIDPRQMTAQVLDSNPIEKERGITIKLAPVRMKYQYNGQIYELNLIDTPGHVDFSYEVSRSLSACEGILLVVDSTQGIQAQTVAHMQLIRHNNLKVVPIINKIDLPTAKVEETKKAMIDSFGFTQGEFVEISAKTGVNIEKVLQTVIEKIPSPADLSDKPLRGLIFSSQYDIHKGVVIYVRIFEGSLDRSYVTSVAPTLKFFATNTSFTPNELGYFHPQMVAADELRSGEVGYIATGLKDLSLARVGDTLIAVGSKAQALAGYKEPKSMVYLSFFPTDTEQFLQLRDGLDKLHLSDSSFTYKLHSSPALGKGFICGFLGLLHADVVRERLEREFSVNVITTAPTVEYEIHRTDGKNFLVHSADDFPDPSEIKEIMEPIMFTTIYTPNGTVGKVMQLCQEKRGELVNLEYISSQAKFTYVVPLSEMIIDFFDNLKSITSGYASLDYEFLEYRVVNAVKLDVLINKKPVDAFSQIVVKEKAVYIGNKLVEKLKELIPKHQFQIPIQAAIGGTVVARADIKSFRKDVTRKLYGGDQTRKDKLLEAQKKGKKRMREFGSVNIPQEVFLNIYK